jgi:hypothetical protein
MKMLPRATLLALTVLVLGACQIAPPAALDPYTGLLPAGQTVVAAPSGFPIAAKGKSLGIVLSVSTEKQLEYIDKAVAEIKGNPMYVYRADFEEVSQPQYLMTSVVTTLKSHFGRVDTIPDFRAASAGKFDYVALIDLSVQLPRAFNYVHVYDLKVDMLNAQFQRIGQIKGFGRESYYCIPIDCALAAQYRALKQASDQFAQGADAALH